MIRFMIMSTGPLLRRNVKFTISHNKFTTLKNREYLALDFDGVICASSQESARAGLYAASLKFPGLVSINNKIGLVEMLQNVRPVVETGYELIVLARYFQESYQTNSKSFNMNSQSLLRWQQNTVRFVMDRWNENLRNKLLDTYGTSKADLVLTFETARDVMMKRSLDSWLESNRLYSHIPAVLKLIDPKKLFIVTTKQERFVRAILEYNSIPILNNGSSNSKDQAAAAVTNTTSSSDLSSNIFDLDNRYGNKACVLQEITRRTSSPDDLPTIHFVEDRYETLLSVLAQRDATTTTQTPTADITAETTRQPALRNVRLYLVDWGYNMAAQRQAALEHPEIELINAKQFYALVERIAAVVP